ncbi:hypothetical protein D1AOALGA4SA_5828 [Olavius algarvensis Delta 1 endosymbiont]|nr:hypothetical protein D1AOALGA4SA_5828 [Olavius algarvensis Delta 1 endosymbiont]
MKTADIAAVNAVVVLEGATIGQIGAGFDAQQLVM